MPHSSKRRRLFAVASAVAAILIPAALASAQEYSSRDIETYQIWDIRTGAGKRDVIRATQDGFNMIVNKSDTITPIVMDAPPVAAQRFHIVDGASNPALAGSGFGALMAMMPATMRSQLRDASCDGAVWIARLDRRVHDSQDLRLTLCLFPYAGGFQLDLYGHDVRLRGGGLSAMLGRAVGEAIVGNEDDWTRRLISSMIQSIHTHVAGQLSFVEGQPDLDPKWQPLLQEIASPPIGGVPPPLPLPSSTVPATSLPMAPPTRPK